MTFVLPGGKVVLVILQPFLSGILVWGALVFCCLRQWAKSSPSSPSDGLAPVAHHPPLAPSYFFSSGGGGRRRREQVVDGGEHPLVCCVKAHLALRTGCPRHAGHKTNKLFFLFQEHAFESSQKYKEGKFIIELAHMIKDNGWE